MLPGDPRQVPRHLRRRAAVEDPRRRVRLGGLRRARRRDRPEPAPPRAAHAQERPADHARLQRHRAAVLRADQLAGRLRRRRVPDQVDRADPAQPRRYARAGGGDPRERGRVRGLRRDLPAEGHADHAGVAGGDQRALVRAAALARPPRRRRRAGDRRADAGRPGDDPLHRVPRPRSRGPAVPVARGARRRVGRAALRGRQRRDPHRPGLAQPAGRVHREPLPGDRREAGSEHRLRRRGQAPRRARLRQALSRARRLPHHRDRRSRSPRLLRRRGRQGGRAVLRDRRPARRGEGARRPGGRRAAEGRAGRARRDDRRRRLGRSARARAGPGSARRRPAQGVGRSGPAGVRRGARRARSGGGDRIRGRRCGDREAARRDARRAQGPLPLLDRGPGYEKMLRGEHKPRI